MRKLVLVLLVFSLSSLTVAAQRPDAPDYAQRGAYQAGTTMFTIDDDERPLTVTMWYPTHDEASELAYPAGLGLSVTGVAVQDAEPIMDETFPLIVLSHGNGGSRLLHLYLTEHLASQGFIVLAVDHPGNTFFDRLRGDTNFITSYALRPLDVLRVIDFADGLNADGQFAGVLDMEHIGVMGHSFGGITSLQVGGARLDFTDLEEMCASDDPALAAGLCFLLDDEAAIAELRGYDAAPTGAWDATNDPRIGAIALLAPWHGISVDLSDISAPVLTIVGTDDAVAIPERDAYYIYENLTSPRHLLTFAYGGHYLFVDECPSNLRLPADFYRLCTDEVWDMARAHDITNHALTTFFLATLKGDESAAEALSATEFAGVTYEAQP